MSLSITEDKAREMLKEKVKCEVGQLTTFKQLGFVQKDIEKLNDEIKIKYKLNKVLSMKPDGWHCDKENNFALVCEIKSSNEDIENNFEQLFSYMYIANTKYEKVVGVIYNGEESGTFKLINGEPKKHLIDVLENIEAYKNFFNNNEIDKNQIYKNTKIINDILHFNLKLKNLNHRMIWTSCVLIANRFTNITPEDSLKVWNQKVIEQLHKEIGKDNIKNMKLGTLIDIFENIKLCDEENISESYEIKTKLINAISEISNNINSNNWNGEDVMAIFFNEFTRYKGKSENGQIFTPDHITSLMFKLANIHYTDHVLDACCGSGSFLTKAMCNMIKDSGGPTTRESLRIKQERIFGIENDREIHALACANMLLHKDGKSNIVDYDTKSTIAKNWIKGKKITKVLMNPPYETKHKPIIILDSVLNSVEPNADCLFLMPNSKLRTNDKKVRKILKKHTLHKIIKLPSETFQGLASTGDVSIFHFIAHKPHNDKDILGYWIKEDGLKTIKNQGRHDISNKWEKDFEPYWVKAIQNGEDPRYNTKKIIKFTDHLEYPDEVKELILFEEDFDKIILDRIFFENPNLLKKFSPYSPKNNPNGISHMDWIVNTLKLLESDNE